MHAMFAPLIAAATLAGVIPAALANVPGPDVVQTQLGWIDDSVDTYGPVGGISALSTGTFSCNPGDADLPWAGFTSEHPVLVQNLYAYEDGRFVQLGMSWAKHVNFVVAQPPSCGDCQTLLQGTPYLGPGCMDPYDAPTNANQTRLGPRSEVNPWTGTFPFPFTSQDVTGDAIFKRLQVADAELDPDLHPAARYFIEGHMVAATEPGENTLNNASHREVFVTDTGPFPQGPPLACTGPTYVGEPAIFAWQRLDPDVTVQLAQVPATGGDGFLHVASRATDNGDGTWRYEIAVHNLNSRRGVRALEVDLPSLIGASGIGFRDVPRHSGDPVSGSDWTPLVGADAVRWETGTLATDNAIGWGLMFNFWFTSDAPPAERPLTLEMHLPDAGAGVAGSIEVVAQLPSAACAGDVNGDGATDAADLSTLIGSFGMTVAPGTSGDMNGDGVVDSADLSVLVGDFGCGGA